MLQGVLGFESRRAPLPCAVVVGVLHRPTRDPVEVIVERGEPPWGDLVSGHVLPFFGGWQFRLWIELARPGHGETRSLAPVDGALELFLFIAPRPSIPSFFGLVVELRERPPLRPVRPPSADRRGVEEDMS